MIIHVKKNKENLSSCDSESLTYIKKMKRDIAYKITITESRNYEHHKKLFAALNIGFENTKLEVTEDGYREYILIKAGHFFTNTFPKYVQFKAKSISYDKLNKDGFEKLYPEVIQQVANDIGITNKELELQILQEF
jgi:hypothetical protein